MENNEYKYFISFYIYYRNFGCMFPGAGSMIVSSNKKILYQEDLNNLSDEILKDIKKSDSTIKTIIIISINYLGKEKNKNGK